MVTNARENRWPTPREFVDEWDQATDRQRLARAERIINDAQAASQCFVMAHDNLEGDVRWLAAKVARVEALRDEWARGAEPVHHRGYIADLVRALAGPSELTDEPTGDAMRWTKEDDK